MSLFDPMSSAPTKSSWSPNPMSSSRTSTATVRSGPRTTVSSRSSNSRSSSAGRYSAPAAPPQQGPGPVPDINAFLNGDGSYQAQIRDFANTLAQFNADITRRKGVLTSDYNASNKAMGDQKIQDLANLQDDYGARGILTSGLYGKAVGDYNNEFNTRMTDLTSKENQAMDQLGQESGRFGSQQQLQQQAAREAAIRRRAEQYGV